MGNKESIHLQDFLNCKNEYEDNQLNEKWNLIKNIRKVSTGAIEKIREEKIIRSSLEAHLDIFVSKENFDKVNEVMFDEITITSSFSLILSVFMHNSKADVPLHTATAYLQSIYCANFFKLFSLSLLV